MYIMKSPISLPKIQSVPEIMDGFSGLFPRTDGWYEIYKADDDYIESKIITYSDINGTDKKFFDYSIDSEGYVVDLKFNELGKAEVEHLIIPKEIDGHIVKTIYENSSDENAGAFRASEIKTVIFLDGEISTIPTRCFQDCKNLESVAVYCNIKTVNHAAFFYCGNLRSLLFFKGLTAIKDTVFMGCGELNSLLIPKTLGRIEGYAFNYCSNLSNIYYEGTDESWSSVTIDSAGNDCITNLAVVTSNDDNGVHCDRNGDFISKVMYVTKDYIDSMGISSNEGKMDKVNSKSIYSILINDGTGNAKDSGIYVRDLFKNAKFDSSYSSIDFYGDDGNIKSSVPIGAYYVPKSQLEDYVTNDYLTENYTNTSYILANYFDKTQTQKCVEDKIAPINSSIDNLFSICDTINANKADRDELAIVKAIATGKVTAYVFDTVSALDEWLAIAENTEKLVVGDNFYIRAVDVPDYWWDGTKKQELECQKVDLNNYYTIQQTDGAIAYQIQQLRAYGDSTYRKTYDSYSKTETDTAITSAIQLAINDTWGTAL